MNYLSHLADGWYRLPEGSNKNWKYNQGAYCAWVYVLDGGAVSLWYQMSETYPAPQVNADASTKPMGKQIVKQWNDLGDEIQAQVLLLLKSLKIDKQWLKAPTVWPDGSPVLSKANGQGEHNFWIENGVPTAVWYGSGHPSYADEVYKNNFKHLEEEWAGKSIPELLRLIKPAIKSSRFEGAALPGLALASVLLGGIVKAIREKNRIKKEQQQGVAK